MEPQPNPRMIPGLDGALTKHLGGPARIWLLVAGMLVGAAGLWFGSIRNLSPLDAPVQIPLWAIIVLFVISESLVAHIELRTDAYSFSLSELTLVVSLFLAAPADVFLGQLLGCGLAIFYRRQALVKGAFNLSHIAFEGAVALVLFHNLIDRSDPLSFQAWMVCAGIAVLVSTLGTFGVAAAIGLSGARIDSGVIARGLVTGYAIALANTSMALLGVYIAWNEPLALTLLAVPTALLFAAYKAYVGQRQKRRSVEFLYESTRSMQKEQSSENVIATLLNQIRDMFRAQTAMILLFPEDDSGQGLLSRIGPGEETILMDPISLDPHQGVWARVAAEGKAILIARPIENDRLRVYFATRGIYKDAMVAPLFGQGGIIGTVTVGDRLGDVSTFDSDDLRLFETLANHASVSLENARLMDRLKDSLVHLAEMNRLKDDFVAAVSHELRTPLTSIQGYVKTLLRPEMMKLSPEEQRDFLVAVDKQSDRLRALIEDLLVVARLDSHQVTATITPVNVSEVVDRVLVELRAHGETHPFVKDLSRSLPRVNSDEGKIQQIITNLIENACKYSPLGAPVTVTAHPEAEGLTISVIDAGIGIPAGEHERIFERFYQVDQSSTREKGGTGLGLYLCRRLAEGIGGRIWLERSDESGSIFSLWVPKAPPAAPIIPSVHVDLA